MIVGLNPFAVNKPKNGLQIAYVSDIGWISRGITYDQSGKMISTVRSLSRDCWSSNKSRSQVSVVPSNASVKRQLGRWAYRKGVGLICYRFLLLATSDGADSRLLSSLCQLSAWLATF